MRTDEASLPERDDGPEWDVDFRAHPERYRVGRGERGVFKVEPYKSELLPHWEFRDPEAAERSSTKILAMFHAYLDADDFVGADMARKYLQMGWTRARRYAKRRSGRKRNEDGSANEEPGDPEKAEAARIFKARYDAARNHGRYRELRAAHRERYG